MAQLRTLIVGASGHNSGNVARLLRDKGHWVRGLVRDPSRAIPGLDDVVVGDVVTGAGLRTALKGVDVAYYFVHALGSGAITDTNDVRAACEFVTAAQDVQLRRAVYFTVLAPPPGVAAPAYQHNRLTVEKILMDGVPGMTAVRGATVLGPTSRGLRPYIRLVQHLRVMPLGPWASKRIAVIDEDAVTECLTDAGLRDDLAGLSVDTPASAQPTHEQIMRDIAAVLGKKRRFPAALFDVAPLNNAVMARYVNEPYSFARYINSITAHDYLVDPVRAWPFRDIAPAPYENALRAAVLGAVALDGKELNR